MRRYGAKPAALAALCLLLCLTACAPGGRRTVHKVDWVTSPGYLAEEAALPVPTGDLTGCCTDGTYMYILASEKTEDGARPVLTRASLADGTAEVLEEYRQTPIADAGEGIYHLGPIAAPDGTLWEYEAYTIMYFDFPEDYDPETESRMKYYTGRDDFYHLRQLDPKTGKLKKLVDLSEAARTLDIESIYNVDGFAVDGSGNLYFAAAGSVTVSDSRGRHLFTLEASMPTDLNIRSFSNTAGGNLALLPDGTVAVLTSLPGGKREVRTIDPAAKSWGAERYALPTGVDLIYSGTGGFLFFFTQGSDLFAWEPESEEPRRLLTWTDTGLTAPVKCFAPMDGGRLAALTLQYTAALTDADSWYDGQLQLSLLSPTGQDPNAGKIKLVYGTICSSSILRNRISRFNQENSQYLIEIRDYANMDESEYYALDSIDEQSAILDAAEQLLRADVAAGRIPDIWDLGLRADAYARQGYLEDLWPWIDGDEALGGRDALMAHALECVSVDGKLYRVGPTFFIATAVARADLVGDRTSWTLEEMLACYRQMPEGTAITSSGEDGLSLLSDLFSRNGSRWIDWQAGTCRFDSQEFRDLLELCRQANGQSGPEASSPDMGLMEGQYLFRGVTLSSVQDLIYYDAVCGGADHLMDYESYLEENQIYASSLDEEGNRRGKDALVCDYLSFAVLDREKGMIGLQPLTADAVFGAVEGGGYAAYPGLPSQDGSGSQIWLVGNDDLSMSASCRHKEGAWAYIRQFLLPGGGSNPYGKFPINKEDFEKQLEPKWFTRTDGTYVLDKEGNQIPQPTGMMTIPWMYDIETPVPIVLYQTALNETQRERFMELYNSIKPSQWMDNELFDIVREQAQVYFAGDSTLDEAVDQIQRRATLYVNENR